MKKKMLASIGLACMITLVACNNDSEPAAGDDSVVAVVDGKEITESEFVGTLKERYGEPTLEEMISTHLLKKAAEDIDISDEEIEEELQNFRANFGTEDDEELLNLIKEQFNIEVESMDELTEDYIIPPLVVKKLSVADVNVTEEQKKKYFEENKDQFSKQIEASHILVEEQEKAEEIIEKLNAGEDFGELAKEYSIDGSAANGGQLGYFGEGKMVKPFEEAAFTMDVDEISEPVKSEFGYHIIKVTGKKETYEDYEEDIETLLTNEQSKTAEEVLDELIKESKVEIKDPQYSDLLKK